MTKTLTILFMLLSVAAFAQTNLADELPAMVKARNADFKGWLQTNTTSDVTFVAGHDGKVYDKAWLLGNIRNPKSHTAELSNVKIQQAGDLAVATGISTVSIEPLEGKKQIVKDAFTYTLRWIGGKWMLTNMHHTKVDYQQ